MNGPAQHEYNFAQLAWRGKRRRRGGTGAGDYASARDETDSLKLGSAGAGPQRKRTQHEVAIMTMKQVIGIFDEPKVAANPARRAAAFEELRHHNLGGVQADDGNPSAAQRRDGIFGIYDGDIRRDLVEKLF